MADAVPLKICLVTDVFPPGSGGSGWSTFYLGKALADLGHTVRVLRPIYNASNNVLWKTTYAGLSVEEALVRPAPEWTARVGLTRAWEERQATRVLARRSRRLAQKGSADILHGQHSVSARAVSLAAASARKANARTASVATIRDYWPLCPSSTRLLPNRSGEEVECSDCHHLRAYLGCVRRSGRGLPSLAAAFARWSHTREVARTLARCDAVIAVSRYVRDELIRSGRFDAARVHTIHNLVDLATVERVCQGQGPKGIVPAGPFLVFAGKLDRHKGAGLLPRVVARSQVGLPVVIAGDGPLRPAIAAEARALGLDFRFADWLDNDAVLWLMRRATCLIFPSCWQEPLSRVLLEGCAAGAAIAAMDTGGTADVIRHGVSGWLAASAEGLAEGVSILCRDADLNQRLRDGARRQAEEKFAAGVVARQVEALYRATLQRVGTS